MSLSANRIETRKRPHRFKMYQNYAKEEQVMKLKAIGILSYLLSLWFIFKGFDKMYNYYNPSANEMLSNHAVNAYVGGDAYNYIINAGYATAYFVLALLFVVVGSTCFICKAINNRNRMASDLQQLTTENQAVSS